MFVSNKPLELLGVHQRLVPRVFLEKLPPLLEEDHHLWLVWRESSKHAIVAFSAPPISMKDQTFFSDFELFCARKCLFFQFQIPTFSSTKKLEIWEKCLIFHRNRGSWKYGDRLITIMVLWCLFVYLGVEMFCQHKSHKENLHLH